MAWRSLGLDPSQGFGPGSHGFCTALVLCRSCHAEVTAMPGSVRGMAGPPWCSSLGVAQLFDQVFKSVHAPEQTPQNQTRDS